MRFLTLLVVLLTAGMLSAQNAVSADHGRAGGGSGGGGSNQPLTAAPQDGQAGQEGKGGGAAGGDTAPEGGSAGEGGFVPVSGGRAGRSGASRGGGGVRGGSARSARSATRRRSRYQAAAWEQWWGAQADLLLARARPAGWTVAITDDRGDLSGRGRSGSADLRERQRLREKVVFPALLRVVRYEQDAWMLAAAIPAVARAVPNRARAVVHDDVVGHLSHEVLDVRLAAVLALGVLDAPGAGEVLTQLVTSSKGARALLGGRDVSTAVAVRAAIGLGLVGDVPAASALLGVVDDQEADLELRVASTTALGSLRGSAADLAVVTLLDRLRDGREDARVRAMAAAALGKLEEPGAVADLMTVLTKRREERLVVQAAALALGGAGDARDADLVDVLHEQARSSRDETVRGHALLSLGRLAARCLDHELGAQVVQALSAQLTRPKHKSNRAWAGLALGMAARARDEIVPLVADDLASRHEREADPSVRSALALACGLARVLEAAPELATDLDQSGIEEVRGYAALALGLLGIVDVRDMALEQALDPTSSGVHRGRMARALRLLGDAQAHEELLAALDDPDGSEEFHWQLLTALGRLRDELAAPRLAKILDDIESSTTPRALAARALGRTGEEREVPWSAALLDGLPPAHGLAALYELVAF